MSFLGYVDTFAHCDLKRIFRRKIIFARSLLAAESYHSQKNLVVSNTQTLEVIRTQRPCGTFLRHIFHPLCFGRPDSKRWLNAGSIKRVGNYTFGDVPMQR